MTDPDDDIPTIRADMLARRVIDFERGMSPWPRASLAIGAACTAAFAGQVACGALESEAALIRAGALAPAPVAAGEYWRLLSAAFLHGSPDHLVGNLAMLFVLGMGCEHAFGVAQFLVLYAVAAVAGSLLSLTAAHTSVGASGAIFGLAGALAVFFVRHRERFELRDKRIGGAVACWAGYQLVLGSVLPGVDNWAHAGGLAGGAVACLVLQPRALREDGAGPPPLAVAGAAVVLLALAATAAFLVPRLAA